MKTINRQVLALAAPAIVSNITTPLLGLMDVAITGHMGSAVYIAAIAVGGTMFNMIYWLFGFLRMGSSGLTAQAFGRGDNSEAGGILYRGLIIALVTGLIIIMFRQPICDLVLGFIDVDEATLPAARRYFLIGVWGAPAMLATFAMSGWLLGMQNSRAGMWTSLVVNLSNIAVSLVAVYGFDMMIAGVAMGTLAAQWIGAVVALGFCVRQGFSFRKALRGRRQTAGMFQFFKVNAYIFLRTLCLIGVTVWFTRMGAMQGAVMLAVNALLMQLFMFFSYFMDGFAYAAEALAGKYVGMHSGSLLKRCVIVLFRWGAGLSLVTAAIYFTGGDLILRTLSDEVSVLEVARDYLPWGITVPLVGFAAFTWDGVYIGLTATARMFVSMLVAMAFFFVLCALLTPSLGNHGLWLAFTAYLAARGIAQTIMARKLMKKFGA